MSAPATYEIPINGWEAVLRGRFRELDPRHQRAHVDMLIRVRDGMSLEDSFVEMLVELGHRPSVTRQWVREVLDSEPIDWRNKLD